MSWTTINLWLFNSKETVVLHGFLTPLLTLFWLCTCLQDPMKIPCLPPLWGYSHLLLPFHLKTPHSPLATISLFGKFLHKWHLLRAAISDSTFQSLSISLLKRSTHFHCEIPEPMVVLHLFWCCYCVPCRLYSQPGKMA